MAGNGDGQVNLDLMLTFTPARVLAYFLIQVLVSFFLCHIEMY